VLDEARERSGAHTLSMSAVIALRSLGGVGGGAAISWEGSVMINAKGLRAEGLRYSHRAKHCVNALNANALRRSDVFATDASDSTPDSTVNTTRY
jgi:hypothetical protein